MIANVDLLVDLEESDGEAKTWKAPEVPRGHHAHQLPNGCMIIFPDVLVMGTELVFTALS